MDSIVNFLFKGYGKLRNTPESFPPQQQPRDRRTLVVTATITAIVLLTLTLGFLLAALIHESVTEPPESSLLHSNLTFTILFVCRWTDHPDSCFDSISLVNASAKPGDPRFILRVSLTVCSQELDKVSAYVAELAKSGSSKGGSKAAIEDCRSQIEDATGKVADSTRRIGDASGIPNDDEIADVATWLSAAMTDGETCLEGLEEVGSTAGADRVKEKMMKAREYLSISLAISANMKKIFEEFNAKSH